ncbi:MAG: Gldg family protein [Ruminiclostridium sp.]
MANPFKSKKFKYGGLSVLFTVLFVAAIVLVNVIVNLVLDRFDVKADLTSEALFSIDSTTTDYLKTLTGKVNITVTSSESDFTGAGTYYNQTNEICKRFAEATDNISLNYVDLLTNPSFSADYPDAEIGDGMLVVKSEETGRYKALDYTKYLDIQYDETYAQYGYSYITAINANAEAALLSAIMSVTNMDPVRVAFTTGYGETENATMKSLLETNAYVAESLNISLVEEIDSGIDFIVIYAPSSDYTNDDLNKLDKWLDNGGRYGKNVIFVASASNPNIPNIKEFLDEWGIVVEDGVIYQTDANYAYSGLPIYQLMQPGTSDYTAELDTKSKYIFGNNMLALTLRFEEYSNFVTTPILTSYDGAVIFPLDADESWTVADGGNKGVLNGVVESSKVQYEGSTPYYSRVVVYGSDFLLNETLLVTEQANNAELMMSIFRGISGRDDFEITLTPKSFSMSTFEISAATSAAIAIIFAIVLPVAIIITGIVVWLRRRHR